jgi:hypothetical protein
MVSGVTSANEENSLAYLHIIRTCPAPGTMFSQTVATKKLPSESITRAEDAMSHYE